MAQQKNTFLLQNKDLLNFKRNDMDEITKLVDELGCKKEAFLDEVESSIKIHVNNCPPKKCMTFITRGNNNVYEPSDIGAGYAEVLCKFVFTSEKKYNGHDIDSILTDEVVEKVSDCFQKFYEKNTNIIVKPLLEKLVSDDTMKKQFVSKILDTINDTLPSYLKKELERKIINYLYDAVNTHIVNATGHNISDLATAIIVKITAANITSGLATVLLKSMLPLLKGVIVKLFASAAFKSFLAVAIKKLVAVKIIGILVAWLGAKLGAAGLAGIPIFWIVVIPLIIWFIAHQINALPNDMAEKISRAVREELNGKFNELNKNIATELLKSFAKDAGSMFATNIANDANFKEFVNDLIANNK